MKHSKVHIAKHLPDDFPIQNGMKQGDAISKVHENQVGLKLNGTN
jgi:hypothetical protein